MNSGFIDKFVTSMKKEGLGDALRRTARYVTPTSRTRRREYREMLKIGDAKQRFEQIYAKNLWGDQESGSGTGSNLKATESLRNALPAIFAKYGITKVLDVPCGDFYWMRYVVEANPHIEYVGGDIVQSVIDDNNKKYRSERTIFDALDLTTDKLPDADLLIVRDCLFHLSFADIEKVKSNIRQSNIRYVLTTTHIVEDGFKNQDIITGDFRLINIFSAPISFPSHPLERVSDYVFPDPQREMCLFEVKLL